MAMTPKGTDWHDIKDIDVADVILEALDGEDTTLGRRDAGKALVASNTMLARLNHDYEVLQCLLTPKLAASLSRAIHHRHLPLVRRTESLAIGNEVIEVFLALIDRVTDGVVADATQKPPRERAWT